MSYGVDMESHKIGKKWGISNICEACEHESAL